MRAATGRDMAADVRATKVVVFDILALVRGEVCETVRSCRSALAASDEAIRVGDARRQPWLAAAAVWVSAYRSDQATGVLVDGVGGIATARQRSVNALDLAKVVVGEQGLDIDRAIANKHLQDA